MRAHHHQKADWDAVDWSLSDAAIGRQQGVSRGRVREKRLALLRRRHGSADRQRQTAHQLQQLVAGRRGTRNHPWRRFNWELANSELALIWHVPAHYCAWRRRVSGLGRARWDRRPRPTTEAAELHEALQAEHAKAAAFANQLADFMAKAGA